MGQIMAHQLQRRCAVFHCVDRDAAVTGDRPLQIPMGIINRGTYRFFTQRSGDICRDLACSNAGVIVTLIAIWKRKCDLGHSCPPRRFGAYQAPGCGYFVLSF